MKKIQVKVIPRSSKNEILEPSPGLLKVKITAAPVDGKANAALVELLAKYFRVPKSFVRILRGENSQNKTVEIMD